MNWHVWISKVSYSHNGTVKGKLNSTLNQRYVELYYYKITEKFLRESHVRTI